MTISTRNETSKNSEDISTLEKLLFTPELLKAKLFFAKPEMCFNFAKQHTD